ncbi:MAG: hypothetical protein H0W64_11560 [Gammaproteobacteria bacterium]|nr:hypothetical protein [Gammaproteobacteria bacterium]
MYLNEIKARIEFLNLIPDDLFLTLNFNEFYMPDHESNLTRKFLEEKFECYIMCYRANTMDNHSLKNLCNLICPATLTQDQVAELNTHESKFKGMVLVAYAKPLRFSACKQID